MNLKRIVVKTGSRVLCRQNGELDLQVLENLVGQMADLHKDGCQLVLVSSGAVAAGSGIAGMHNISSSDPVTRRQVLAAAGQVRLMQTYQQLFGKHGLTIAQVLASKSDFQTRNHYLNMRNCIEGILSAGMVPVVNENDVVSVTELMFTDNDELAGLLASMVNADLLAILSTVKGVIDQGTEAAGQQVIETWDDEKHQIEDIVSSGASRFGRGGMHSKLSVARKTAALGTRVVIANGRAEDILQHIVTGQAAGTCFPASGGSGWPAPMITPQVRYESTPAPSRHF
jgi:glutamate 5-kinase